MDRRMERRTERLSFKMGCGRGTFKHNGRKTHKVRRFYGMMKLSGRRVVKGETEDHGMLKNVGAAPSESNAILTTSLTWSFPSRDQLQLHDLHRR